jgi:hypothetical protein
VPVHLREKVVDSHRGGVPGALQAAMAGASRTLGSTNMPGQCVGTRDRTSSYRTHNVVLSLVPKRFAHFALRHQERAPNSGDLIPEVLDALTQGRNGDQLVAEAIWTCSKSA